VLKSCQSVCRTSCCLSAAILTDQCSLPILHCRQPVQGGSTGIAARRNRQTAVCLLFGAEGLGITLNRPYVHARFLRNTSCRAAESGLVLCCAAVFRESIPMGETSLSPQQVQHMVQQMGQKFKGNKYHLLQLNCNHFANELCLQLTNKPAPSWVSRGCFWYWQRRPSAWRLLNCRCQQPVLRSCTCSHAMPLYAVRNADAVLIPCACLASLCLSHAECGCVHAHVAADQQVGGPGCDAALLPTRLMGAAFANTLSHS
jgi:hypothetical protein